MAITVSDILAFQIDLHLKCLKMVRKEPALTKKTYFNGIKEMFDLANDCINSLVKKEKERGIKSENKD